MVIRLKMANTVALCKGECDNKILETNPFNTNINTNCDCVRMTLDNSRMNPEFRAYRERRKRRRLVRNLVADSNEMNQNQTTFSDCNISEIHSILHSTAATTTAATYTRKSKWTTCPTSTASMQSSIASIYPTNSPLCNKIQPDAALSLNAITCMPSAVVTLKRVSYCRVSTHPTQSKSITSNNDNIAPRKCKRRTPSAALNTCNLLPRLLTTLVWHVTASTAIALLATLCYFMAHHKGVAAMSTATVLQFPYLTQAEATTSYTTATTRIATTTTTPRTASLATNFTFYGTNSSTTTKGHRNGNSRLSRSGSHKRLNNNNNNNNDIDTSNANNTWNSNINSTEVVLNDISPSSASTISAAGYENVIRTLTTTNHYGDVVIAINDSNTRNISQTGVAGVEYGIDGAALDDISAEDASEYVFDRTDVRIIFITLYTMVFCCCFFGNLLVILVVTLSRRLRSITNFFLANLALADFCVGLFCVMQNLSIYLIDSWVFGEFLCRMYQFVHSLSYTASIFILVVICMERYFAIVHPITCKQILTAARLRMVILTVWITSAVYSTPKFVFSKTIKNVHTESGQEEEICVLDRKMFNSKLLDMINFGLLYVIPLLVMTVLYSKIAIALWRSSRGLSHHLAQQQDNSMGLHNSMYHHHHNPLHNHHQHPLHNNHQMQQSSTSQPQQALGTPLSVNSSVASGGTSTLSRKQSSKYEKRGVSITESQHDNFQVSLDADRPVVSACRKTSFYQHNHLTQQHSGQTTALTAGNHHRPHLHNHNHGSHHGPHSSQRVSHFSHSSNNVLRARRGVVRMLIIFVLTFALCNLPYHARKMWQYWSRSYRGDSNFNALLTPLTFLVTYFNSGINPLLYAFLSRNFRKGMKELLMCSWRKSKTKSSTNSSMHHKRMTLQTHSLPTDTTHIGNEQL